MLAVATVAMGLARAQEPTRAEADSMQTKIDRVAATAEAPPRAANEPPLKTTFSEREINAYLVLDGPDFLPSGITKPRVRLDDGRVEARAVVDLDRVRRSRERGAFDPLAYITGTVEVVASGRIEGRDGEGLIRYESATVAGVGVPKTVAQELLRFYTSTPGRPSGFAFDEPFALPAGLRAVDVERAAAIVTQ
jgi:hypothetical protein